jgi:enoyl-CoA hydratase/carnithine racemase
MSITRTTDPATSVEERRVEVSFADHIATVKLCRPERHNALDLAMIRALRSAMDQVERNRSARVVLLHGEGPSFCSGLDFPSFMTEGGFEVEALLARPDGAEANLVQSITAGWTEISVPVIAAIHGAVFGGGLQIALGADLRISASDARLSLLEAKWGLLPDMGVTRALPRLVGIDVAKELTYSGRVFDGNEAHRLGLVTRVCEDPLRLARSVAAEWATRSPDALRRAKRLWEQSWTMSRRDSLHLEEQLQRELFETPNHLEALRAGLARETPIFVDPR